MTNSSFNVTTIPLGKSMQAIAVNSHTNLVYVADAVGNELYILDSNAGCEVKTHFPVGNTPYSLAIDVKNNLIYVLCQNMSSNFSRGPDDNPWSFIQVYDGATNKLVHQIDFYDGIPSWITINQTTQNVYAVGASGALRRIVNFQQVKMVLIGGGYQVAADPTNNLVYATYLGPHFQLYVGRFQGANLEFIDQTILSPNGDGVAVNTQQGVVYTTSIGTYNQVQVWDPKSNPMKNIANVQTGGYPQHVAVNEVLQRYYTNNYSDSTVTIVDAKTNTTMGEAVPVGSSPYDIAVDQERGMVFTANYWGSVSCFQDL